MLGSIIRSLIFVGVVGGLVWGVSQLMETPGEITITFADLSVTLTPLAAAIGLMLGFVGIWLAIKLLGFLIAILRFLSGDETALSRYFERNRMRRGLEALSKGMTAVAAGDGRLAQKKAKRAEKLLRRPELTRLLNAQAAELAGDTRRARTYYRALAADQETAFVGIKGLLGQAMEAGETEKALKLAQYGFALKPDDPKLLETLYGLQSEVFDWSGARATLAAQSKAGLIGKDDAQRREATLALAQAEEAEMAKDTEQAKKYALEASKLDHANAEAVCAAARRLIAEGSKRAASRQIVEAWRLQPDPRLAAAFAEIEPDETPPARRKRFRRLFEVNPAHAETKFLRAELALQAEDWTGARAAIGELQEEEPSARALAIMAAIARGEGEPDHVVRAWLARAIGAPRAAGSEGDLSQSAMLPLLIGEAERRSAEGAETSVSENADAPGGAGTGPQSARPESARPESQADPVITEAEVEVDPVEPEAAEMSDRDGRGAPETHEDAAHAPEPAKAEADGKVGRTG